MSALIADPPKLESASANGSVRTAQRSCRRCGSALEPGQDWCLDCGSAVRSAGSMRGYPLSLVGAAVVLAVAAAASAYAALATPKPKAAAHHTVYIQQVAPAPPAAVVPPVAPVVPASKPKHVIAPKVPATVAPVTATPAPAATTPATTPTTTTTTTTPKAVAPKPAAPVKILLDTNAASTYNPTNLPATSFGDPASAIDGDTTTAWTYQLDPTTAGVTQVGLAIDMQHAQTVRGVELNTSSKGISIVLYGAVGAAPATITDPLWIKLASVAHLPDTATLKLTNPALRKLRTILVWITNAPTKQTTGTVGIAELSVLKTLGG